MDMYVKEYEDYVAGMKHITGTGTDYIYADMPAVVTRDEDKAYYVIGMPVKPPHVPQDGRTQPVLCNEPDKAISQQEQNRPRKNRGVSNV